MDPAVRWYLEDEDSLLMKTFKGATTGLVAGTIWGTVVATWYDVPRVERSVALPGLLRTFKMMGGYRAIFAAIGGVYIGVEQLVQNYRGKRDLVNGVVGGFVAGASILGYRVCIFLLAMHEEKYEFIKRMAPTVIMIGLATALQLTDASDPSASGPPSGTQPGSNKYLLIIGIIFLVLGFLLFLFILFIKFAHRRALEQDRQLMHERVSVSIYDSSNPLPYG